MTFFLIFILIFLFFLLIIISQRIQINNFKRDEGKLMAINYNRFTPTADEINDAEKQIAEKGFWSESREWKLMTATDCSIEPYVQEGRTMYKVKVKCEFEITFPAATIERAILFKKIYEAMQQKLYADLGWSSYKSKDQLN